MLMKQACARLLIASSALLLTSALSYADDLPFPTATVTLTNSTILPDDESTQTVTSGSINLDFSGGGVTVVGTSNFEPSPALTGSTSVNGIGLQGTAESFIEYFFSVIGPTGVNVPILISSQGGISRPLVSANSVQLYLGTPSGTNLLDGACLAPVTAPGNCIGLPERPSYSSVISTSILSDSLDIIDMDLFVVANTFDGSGSDAQSAFLDPVITIDPTFADAAEFRLQFSPGVGNNPIVGIPEASTWTMLVTGFVALGGVVWPARRRSTHKLA